LLHFPEALSECGRCAVLAIDDNRVSQAVHAESVDGDLYLPRVGEYAFIDTIGRD
jgi:hypothetical protein